MNRNFHITVSPEMVILDDIEQGLRYQMLYQYGEALIFLGAPNDVEMTLIETCADEDGMSQLLYHAELL